MPIRHLSRVLGTRSSRKTLGVYLSTFFVMEAHRVYSPRPGVTQPSEHTSNLSRGYMLFSIYNTLAGLAGSNFYV